MAGLPKRCPYGSLPMTIGEVTSVSGRPPETEAGRSIEKTPAPQHGPNPIEGRGPQGLPNRPAGLRKTPTAGSGITRPWRKYRDPERGWLGVSLVLHSRPLKFRTARSAFKASVARPSGWLDSTFMIAICNDSGTLCLGSSLGLGTTRGPQGARAWSAVRTTLRHTSQKSVPPKGDRQARGNHRRSGQERGNLNRFAGAALLLPAAGCHQWRF